MLRCGYIRRHAAYLSRYPLGKPGRISKRPPEGKQPRDYSGKDPHLSGNSLAGPHVAGQFKRNHIANFKRLPAIEQRRHVDESVVASIAPNKPIASI
jgi:hypothetical protein